MRTRTHSDTGCTIGACIALMLFAASLGASSVQAQSRSSLAQWTLATTPGVIIEGFGDSLPFATIAGAAITGDGSIVVADQRINRVFFFSRDGKPRASAGRTGSGPGEFRGIIWLGRCEPDTVSVFDPVLRRITRFSPTGDIVGSRSAAPQGPQGFWIPNGRMPYLLTCASGGAHALSTWPNGPLPQQLGPHRGRVSVAVATRASAPYTLVGEFAGPERYRFKTSDGPRPFGKALHLAVSDSRLFVGTADSFVVRQFDLKGRPLPDIRWNAPQVPFTKEDKERYAGRAAWTLASVDVQRRMQQQMNALEFPEVLPAYDRFLLDDEQRLWVQASHAPTHRRRSWWGFDREGALIATLELPAEFSLLQLTSREALGTWTDEDGVQTVRRYALVPLR